jgi:hypothetical protein
MAEWVGLGLMAVGTVVKTVSGLNAATAQSRAAKKEAGFELQKSELEAQGEEQALALDQSKVGAQYGASGVVPGEGSALDVVLHNARTAARRVQDIRNAGQLKAYSLRERARLASAQKTGIIAEGMLSAGTIATLGYHRGGVAAPKSTARPLLDLYDND